MKENIIKIRNKIFRFFYQNICKKIFFRIDPETIHDIMTNAGIFLGKYKFTKKLTSFLFHYENKILEQEVLGIKFKNPIGLAAGFDKDALLTNIMPYIGYGHEEVGSITGEFCEGNPKPRLWRLKKSKSLVVYYGLKNEGCETIAKRLEHKRFKFPIGTSIAKTNCKETAEVNAGVEDYLKAFTRLANIGHYFTINISCPNAYGGEPFTDPKSLEKLLVKMDKIKTNKPVFIKLAADLTIKEIDDILEVIKNHRIHGIICTNLTKNRDNEKIIDEEVPKLGGISGKVVQELSDNMIEYIYKKTKGQYILVGCGGISTAQDAYKKIKSGATLVQMISGMIFEGPQTIGEINQGLVQLLKKDGYKNISEAVGANIK